MQPSVVHLRTLRLCNRYRKEGEGGGHDNNSPMGHPFSWPNLAISSPSIPSPSFLHPSRHCSLQPHFPLSSPFDPWPAMHCTSCTHPFHPISKSQKRVKYWPASKTNCEGVSEASVVRMTVPVVFATQEALPDRYGILSSRGTPIDNIFL